MCSCSTIAKDYCVFLLADLGIWTSSPPSLSRCRARPPYLGSPTATPCFDFIMKVESGLFIPRTGKSARSRGWADQRGSIQEVVVEIRWRVSVSVSLQPLFIGNVSNHLSLKEWTPQGLIILSAVSIRSHLQYTTKATQTRPSAVVPRHDSYRSAKYTLLTIMHLKTQLLFKFWSLLLPK